MLCKCFQYKIAVLVCVLWSLVGAAYGQETCAETSRWIGMLENRLTGETEYYTADEIFSGTEYGAAIPGYDGDKVWMPHFYFSDTSCITDEFELEFKLLKYTVGSGVLSRVVAGMSVFSEPENPFLRSGDNVKRIEIESKVRDSGNGLRSNMGWEICTLGFKYKDGVLYFLENGEVNRVEWYSICRIGLLTAYWEYGGGGSLVSIHYKDITNGTEYYENFSDCRNEQAFPECEPEPVVELTAGFEMPGCEDSTLRFYANSNLLEDFHWIGPNGFRSDEQNPSIEGASYLMNGTYTVWGQLDRCSPPVSFDVVVNISDFYKKDTAMSFEFCSKDSVIVDGKVYKETGHYVDTLVASNGCDSIVSFSIERKYTEHYFNDTICYGESYDFGGVKRFESGFFVETFKGANSCGCDSIVGVHLTVLPKPEYMEKEVLICQNDSFELNGSYYKGKVLVYDTIRGRFGCDSVIVEVNVDTFPANWEERPDVHFCEGFPVTIDGVVFEEDTTLIDTAVGADGCPLYIKTEVIKDMAVPLPDSFSFAGCKLSEFSLSVTEIEGASYKWTPRIYLSSDTVSNPSVRPYTNVEYKVEIKYGTCREEVPVSVEIFDVPKIVRVEQELGGGHVVVRSGSKPYYFSVDGNSFSRDSTFSDLQAGMYQAVVEDALGCVDTANFFVFIPIIPEDHFTPNGDGVKDLWEIENIEQYDDYVIRIYDRFGKLLVEYDSQYPGWDGTYNGVDMPSTDYWYVIDLEFLDYNLSGHFTLVRK